MLRFGQRRVHGQSRLHRRQDAQVNARLRHVRVGLFLFAMNTHRVFFQDHSQLHHESQERTPPDVRRRSAVRVPRQIRTVLHAGLSEGSPNSSHAIRRRRRTFTTNCFFLLFLQPSSRTHRLFSFAPRIITCSPSSSTLKLIKLLQNQFFTL